ncbi:MAG: peptide chain release factor 1 [bacterium]|nr:peptide chain release factor 1 [bacterium]
MLKKIKDLEDEFDEITALMSDSSVVSDGRRMSQLGKRQKGLQEIIATGRELSSVYTQIEEAKSMMEEDDDEIREMAKEELETLNGKEEELAELVRGLLLPKDPNDEKDVIVEIRAGTGGDESALFAGDLFDMYLRYAETNGWKVDVMDSHLMELGGYKTITFGIEGDEVYSRMKYESGVHRVQRVPETESQGRIHTSAATVAVLPEADEVEIEINPDDIKVDVYRASGPGGQGVNTTDSAVRLTHVPTGLIVTCQDERSQHKNKAKAMKILKARLFRKMQEEAEAERASERKSMVGSGDRSERIRTYNYPQGRVSDHRINLTLYKLPQIMQGDLDELINALADAERENLLADPSG